MKNNVCRGCGKPVAQNNIGSEDALGRVRCKPCVHQMLKNADVQTLDTSSGRIVR